MTSSGPIVGGVKELGHVVLYVRDIERSVRFYRDVLGWREIVPEATSGSPPRCSPADAPTTSCC